MCNSETLKRKKMKTRKISKTSLDHIIHIAAIQKAVLVLFFLDDSHQEEEEMKNIITEDEFC